MHKPNSALDARSHFRCGLPGPRAMALLLFVSFSTILPPRSEAASGLARASVPQMMLKDSSLTFPITPVGLTSTFCTDVCYCSNVNACNCDRSGTITLNHALSSPFSSYNFRVVPVSTPSTCSSGSIVQLPVALSAGQKLQYSVSFSPTRTGSFNDQLNLSGYILSLSGSTPRGSASLIPFQPAGWSAPLVVSKTTGTQLNSPELSSSDPLYLSWAVQNAGDLDAIGPFYFDLYLDGAVIQRWRYDGTLAPQHYAYVKDYGFGPLTSGTHTLELVPDPTHAIGTSPHLTKSFVVTSPARVVAESINFLAGATAVSRTQKVDLGGAQGLSFAVGESFRLKVVRINADGSDGSEVSSAISLANQAPGPPPVASGLEGPAEILFSGTVILGFSDERQKYFPVHSGTSTLSLQVAGRIFPVSATVSSSGYRLGTKPDRYDDFIQQYSDLHGLPPHIVKAVIIKESSYLPKAYRYEPLSIDFAQVSTCGTSCGNGTNLRSKPAYSAYSLQTFADSLNQAMSQGSGINETDISLREHFQVVVDSNRRPLQVLLSPPSSRQAKRVVELADPPISMENILYTNNSTQVGGPWYSSGTSTAAREASYRKYRKTHTPFTAQTVLAASYGLMQATIPTAFADGYSANGSVRQPSDLFEPNINIDLGTDILATKYRSGSSTSQPRTMAELQRAWDTALVRYNGGSSYGADVLKSTAKYFPIPR